MASGFKGVKANRLFGLRQKSEFRDKILFIITTQSPLPTVMLFTE
ncbi:hypothetical protein DSBG_2863 [Desulfosporosinus sp. BG]|nr:hypothetical protein DSBG_2863 [Desulfosporosinus sp. BG]